MWPGGEGSSRGGFTLLELATVLVIVAILTALIIGGVGRFRARAQRLQCTANLKSLSVAANLYLQEHNSWPQIPPGPDEQFADAWITALMPFGAERKTWICPTIQNLLKNPDYSKPETARIDYVATPFDSKPNSPRQWPKQPWFVETGDVHGNGNLIIFTDGTISDMRSVIDSSVRKR